MYNDIKTASVNAGRVYFNGSKCFPQEYPIPV